DARPYVDAEAGADAAILTYNLHSPFPIPHSAFPMHLILTHEQADFDAVAAQLAAWRLHPDAIPLLPHRLNRNVRACLTLYGGELPFVAPDDLPRGSVERVTLVDTQTLVTLKGMSARTAVHLIDHHPLGRALPQGWSATLAETGATTTLLAEELADQDRRLTSTHATLLLLGIYEDTGSLSYGSTTPRDVRAAAWLLEQGASLTVAAEFLNHPLSPDQFALYERLLEATEFHQINGQRVALAAAEAGELVEEISTLAHKLRDLYDPAGLFLLVGLNAHVQLVARSTTDAIDVGQIAAHFGGGGHDRAAAALIRDRPLAEVRAELLRLLPETIRPALAFARLMSRDPQVLPADAEIAEAAALMRRHGFEGFPVVDPASGALLGLLTRRAVDRAVAHKMGGRPVREVMEAGMVSVTPRDSLETLQRAMMDSGWGQVPVVDEARRVIGIVTRTDLLKTLAAPGARPGRTNLAGRLERALPPARLALLRAVARAARPLNAGLYIVGGFVRDLLLDTPSLDFDLVVEGDAIALANTLARAHGGRVTSHARFGTAKWRPDRGAWGVPSGGEATPHHAPLSTLDLISARTEFYAHPTALPQVERGSIKLDLHRRDFTINTLALRLDEGHFGELLDFWGGERDLREGRVRVLHSLSFVDDPTRLLRAVRLEQRLGFQIEGRTRQLMDQALPLLDRVSGDRIRHELQAMFNERDPEPMLARLHGLGILRHIHPALAWDEQLAADFATISGFRPDPAWRLDSPPPGIFLHFGILLARLESPACDGIIARLKFGRAEADLLRAVNRLWADLPALSADPGPARLTRALDEYPLPAIALLAALAPAPAAARLGDYLARLRFMAPTVNGAALTARGLTPGPVFGRILRALRDAWLDGQISDPAGEAALLNRLIAGASPQSPISNLQSPLHTPHARPPHP
ncbi:MAG: CBS domain-containing protein, partial [Chloroflexi bacterium]|nr:CBS domain-containing protein [Chloroflexota bacterium]